MRMNFQVFSEEFLLVWCGIKYSTPGEVVGHFAVTFQSTKVPRLRALEAAVALAQGMLAVAWA